MHLCAEPLIGCGDTLKLRSARGQAACQSSRRRAGEESREKLVKDFGGREVWCGGMCVGCFGGLWAPVLFFLFFVTQIAYDRVIRCCC